MRKRDTLFALYVKQLRLTGLSQLKVETAAGTIITELISDELVKVNMGAPILNGPQIPVMETGMVLNRELQVGNRAFSINAVSMGNPHAVIYTDELSDELVHTFGKQIEHHPFFPNKTNVEFVKIISNKEISMRVWERGCGETQACGTGACACAVSGILNNLHDNDVIVHLPGGDLRIQWNGKDTDPVFMTGEAKRVFEGSIEVDL